MDKQKEIDRIKKNINDLVYEKTQLRKAYNYYHCVRDAEQFRHIEDNYGIGVPTSVGFTPLVKKHIDVLVGEYLELDPELQITCKDERTISLIMRDKQLQTDKELYEYLKKHLQNAIISIFNEGNVPVADPLIEDELNKIKKNIDKTFVSEYEIAAQNILTYIRNSRDIDLKNKMRELLTDLLVSGICYYRVKESGSGDNVSLEILNPLDTFIERNRNSYYLNRSPRAVSRKWMTKEQILSEFDDELSDEAKERLDQSSQKADRNSNTVYIRSPYLDTTNSPGVTRATNYTGILGGYEAVPVLPFDNSGRYMYSALSVIPVYYVEWIESDNNGKLCRHEGVRIGEDIFITRGESKNIVRSQTNPKDCTLSINGIFFNDRNGNPFSVMLSTMDLQDKYDLLIYSRDNLIASSGTVGDWIDIAHVPSVLGVDLPDRIQKWLAYKKNGVALYDSSQEGTQMINTTFSGYDDTIKGQTIQAIQLVIESLEQQVSSITGVFKDKLGDIAQRDAVTNVKVNIRNSTLLTKQYFNAMDSIYTEINYDMLNLAKIVFKKGLSGVIVLGDKLSKVFVALPEYYTVTDFDIHIQDSTQTFRAKETIESLNVELIKGGLVDAGTAINIVLSKNITELKQYVEDAIKEKKAENDIVKQQQQQLQQAQQQMKQMQSELQKQADENNRLKSQLENNSAEKLEIEKKRLAIEEKTANDKKEYNDKILENKDKQLDAQIYQLNDGNPYNDKIKQI